jgi:hypothetical protein
MAPNPAGIALGGFQGQTKEHHPPREEGPTKDQFGHTQDKRVNRLRKREIESFPNRPSFLNVPRQSAIFPLIRKFK